jgi:protein-S-isoprenylcysteine O-methyltransferase Ste14
MHPVQPPRSAVSGATGAVGLIGLSAAVVLCRWFGLAAAAASVVALVACAAAMLAWTIAVEKAHLRPSTGLRFDRARPLPETIGDSAVKLVGLWATWGAIACLYAVLRWYAAPEYGFPMHVLLYGAIPLLLLSIPYIVIFDRFADDRRDGCWHAGSLVLGRWRDVRREALEDHARAWIIKAFFLPYVLVLLPDSYVALTGGPADRDPVALAAWAIGVLFFVDIVFGAVGYACTFKAADTHIRSANPYAIAWVAALACYPPFIVMGRGGPLDYHPHGQDWSAWLAGSPVLLALWGMLLVALLGVYVWATVIFGLRFSNLTHRGIITNGPYRFLKHPAYVAKNLFWWAAAMPFLSTVGPFAAVRNCALLLAVNALYLVRARTEERHLLADPDYQAYARWIERHGPLRRLFARDAADRGVQERAPR